MSSKTIVKQPKMIISTVARNCKYQPVSFVNTEEVIVNRHAYKPNDGASIIVKKMTWFDKLFK